MIGLRQIAIGFVVLTTMVWATERHFYLEIDDEFEIMAPDSNFISAQGFYLAGESASVPGPTLSVSLGDQVFIHFHNTSGMAQMLHFHGLDVDAATDGFPGLSNSVQAGDAEIYQFTANQVGDFAYVAIGGGPYSRNMGLYGLIRVRLFDIEPEYDLVSIGVDPALVTPAVPTTDPIDYTPEFLMIGGRVQDLSGQINLLPVSSISVTDTVRLNLLNPGFWPQVINFGSGNAQIISSDGRMWDIPEAVEMLKIYPGERYGVRLSFPEIGDYSGEWSVINPLTGEQILIVTWNQVVVDPSLMRGDLNGDMTINIQDIIQLVGIILGDITPTPEQLFTADLNIDEQVDVTDVVTLVNLILGQ